MTRRLASPDTAADGEIRELLDARPLRAFTVIAGAGSGKTTSLVKALDHVARQRGDDLRSRGQKVACITYTEVAAKEIAADVGAAAIVHVSTIHSFLWAVIRPFQTDIHRWVQSRVDARLKKYEAEIVTAPEASKKAAHARERVRRYTQDKARLDGVRRFRYGIGADYGNGVVGHSDVRAMVPAMILERPLLARSVAARFPYVFVDESQDTFPEVVECLTSVYGEAAGRMALGFFGDPMQRIYLDGIGDVTPGAGWGTVTKPENFRSSQKVLGVVNRVRKDADGLQQISGLPAEQQRPGEVWCFVLPADDKRDETLRLVRHWLTENGASGDWRTEAPGSAKVLMILHKMAAEQLGFIDLHEAFHSAGSRTPYAQGFDDGTAWPLAAFETTILPLVDPARTPGQTVAALRTDTRVLSDASLDGTPVRDALRGARDAIAELRAAAAAGGPGSVGRVLQTAAEHGLATLDPRLETCLDGGESEELEEADRTVLTAFAKCDMAGLAGYFDHMAARSPYSTQHGTKGTEYPRVLLVLDDERGNWNQYSYEKLLGLQELSKTDRGHLDAGTDSVLERTRRLLYVSVSRATDALAVVLFTSDVDLGVDALRRSGLAGDEPILTLTDLEAPLD